MSGAHTIRVFAGAAEAVGGSRFHLEATSIEALVALLNPADDAHIREVLDRCSYLVNGTREADTSAPIPAGASIDVLPPFAGG